jgi:hypothetical protein
VHGGHRQAFFGIRRRSGGWAAIFGQGADMDFYGLEQPRYIRKPLNLLEDWCRNPVIKNDGF